MGSAQALCTVSSVHVLSAAHSARVLCAGGGVQKQQGSRTAAPSATLTCPST